VEALAEKEKCRAVDMKVIAAALTPGHCRNFGDDEKNDDPDDKHIGSFVVRPGQLICCPHGGEVYEDHKSEKKTPFPDSFQSS